MDSLLSVCAPALGVLVLVGCGAGSNGPVTGPGPSGVLNLYANGAGTPVSSSAASPYTITLAQSVTITVSEAGYGGVFFPAVTSGAPCFGATGSGNTFVISADGEATCAPGAGAVAFTDTLGHSATIYLNAL
jgi:hypothetical protein